MYRNKKMPSKRYKQAFEARNGGEHVSLVDAIAALAKFPRAKFDESVDLAQHAAWTTVANAILNLDEVLTKE